MQRFKSEIQNVSVHRRLNRPQISHELRRGFCDESAFFSEPLRISYSVITFIGCRKPGKHIFVRNPVEFSGIDYSSADACAMSVQIFCRRMSYDVRPPFDWTTIYRSRKSVVDNQRNIVVMRRFCEFFNVENSKRRICDGFPENRPCVAFKSRVQFIFRCVGFDERRIDSHFFQCDRNKIERSAVNRGRSDDMASRLAYIENGKKISRLTRRREHSCRSAFKRSKFCRDKIVRGILKPCVKISAFFKVEQSAHVFACVVFESRGLNYRNLARLSIFRLIARMNAFCVDGNIRFIFHR